MEGGGRLVKGQKKGLWMPQNLIDLSDLGGEEGAALQLCERRQVWIIGEKAAEFLPGGLRLDVGEIALSKLSSAH